MSRHDIYNNLKKFSLQHEKQFKVIYRQAILDAKDAVVLRELEQALENGNIEETLIATQVDKFDNKLSEMVIPLATAFLAGATVAFQELPAAKQKQGQSIDLLNAYSMDYLKQHGAKLVTQVSQETKAAIRKTIETVLLEGKSYKSAAREIKAVIGLTLPQQQALANLKSTLVKQELNQSAIQSAIEKRTQTMIRERADTIARTETFSAISRGRQALWQQLKNDGVIETTTQRIWLTANDERVDCSICKPMNNQKQLIDANFETGDGQSIDAPPAHPNCRCTVILDS